MMVSELQLAISSVSNVMFMLRKEGLLPMWEHWFCNFPGLTDKLEGREPFKHFIYWEEQKPRRKEPSREAPGNRGWNRRRKISPGVQTWSSKRQEPLSDCIIQGTALAKCDTGLERGQSLIFRQGSGLVIWNLGTFCTHWWTGGSFLGIGLWYQWRQREGKGPSSEAFRKWCIELISLERHFVSFSVKHFQAVQR